MAEDLFPKFVFMGVFFGMVTILCAIVLPTIEVGTHAEDPSIDWGALGIYQYTFYDPNPYEIGNSSVKSHYDWQHESTTFTSDQPHRHDINVWIIRNNTRYDPGNLAFPRTYNDCLLFEMTYGVFNFETRRSQVSYETIISHFDEKTNMSQIPIRLNADYMAFFSTGPGYTFHEALWWNEYNISIGFTFNLTDEATATPWGLVGQILTFQIPNVGFFINAMIAIPMYCLMGFTVIAIISRFVPTVPGL